MNGVDLTLLLAAMMVGSLHSLAPDHWMPLGALARVQGWSKRRTVGTTLLCGFGHVTVSAILGLLALVAGKGVIEAFGHRMESLAGLLLIGFGLIYAIWGVRRSLAVRLHGHAHSHYDHVHDTLGTTEWTLAALYSVDPCVALIPILVAAGASSWTTVVAIILAYEVACLSTMVALVVSARAGGSLIRNEWLGRWEHATAGIFIAVVGVVVGILGI